MASSRHINGKAHFFAEGKDTSLRVNRNANIAIYSLLEVSP